MDNATKARDLYIEITKSGLPEQVIKQALDDKDAIIERWKSIWKKEQDNCEACMLEHQKKLEQIKAIVNNGHALPEMRLNKIRKVLCQTQ